MKTVRAQIYFALSLAILLGVSSNGCGNKNESSGANVETRVAVKTGLPSGTDPNNSKLLTFADFISIPEPPGVVKNDPRYDKQRIPAFSNPQGVKEGDVVSVKGYIHVVTLMGDGDYNIRLTATPDSSDNYIVSEIPDDDDISDKTLRPMVIAARNFIKSQMLQGKDPSRQGTNIDAPAYIQLTGQLYFSDNHVGDAPAPDKQGTHRATSWQIHPGLAIAFNPETTH
jgi:hypothetical protein|nr:hypothetical protein [Candidatus Acidoferrales bacterium]